MMSKGEIMSTRKSEMDSWGIGLKWLRCSFVILIPLFICAWLFRSSLIADNVNPWVYYGAGILLLVIGLPFWFLSAVTTGRNFKAGKLCTSGVFAVCRNPIYASWILFLVPGVLMFFRIPLLLLSPITMYVTLRVFLGKEEQWLEQTFGSEYMEYKKMTNRILPGVSGLLRLYKNGSMNRTVEYIEG
jgi:protein-S-isoprenylcysteine O-methyltransferase Ste14